MQFLLDKFEDDPGGAWTTTDLAIEYYGVQMVDITKSHRGTMVRVMKKVAEIRHEILTENSRGVTGQMVVFDGTHPLSRCIADIKRDSFYGYQNGWYDYLAGKRVYSQNRDRKILHGRLEEFADQLLPGGRLYLEAEIFKAEMNDDTDKAAELKAELQMRLKEPISEHKAANGNIVNSSPSVEELETNAGLAAMKLLSECPDKDEFVYEMESNGMSFKIVRITD